MKHILLSCLFFKNLTGSEIYYYELAKALIKLGYNVTIAANVIGNGDLMSLARKEGYDSKFHVQHISNIHSLKSYDLVICSHVPNVKHLTWIKSNENDTTPIISINHHEHYPLEQPIVTNLINKYIGIRPAICKKLSDVYGIENPQMVWNPFDFNRYPLKPIKEFDVNKKNTILYCGTIDAVRKESIYDCADMCQNNGWKMLLVGTNHDHYLYDLLGKYNCIEYHEATNDIEQYFNQSDATAGVFIGRTTIEGWLCGIPGYVYLLDEKNHIISKELQFPPDDRERFDEDIVIKEILKGFE